MATSLSLAPTAVCSQLRCADAAPHSVASPPRSMHLTPSSLPSRSLRLSSSASSSSSKPWAPVAVRAAADGAEAAEVVVEEDAVAEEAVAAGAAEEEAKFSRLGSSVEGKQRLLLKFVWLDKNIGIAVDQLIPGKGTVPISPYMFWPRKDAWEQLRETLESKPWLSRKRTIILLNQATDIINLWQSTAFKP